MDKNISVKVMPRITRGCGTRIVGGLYIFCDGVTDACYRFPMKLPDACPCCGEELRQLRSVRIIDPHKLWGDCTDDSHPCHRHKCFGCFPPTKAGLMWVGKEYTPSQFVREAQQFGVSKRIPKIPKQLKIGDRLFLVHNEVFPEYTDSGVKNDNRAGVFFASTITEFQKIVSEKQVSDTEYINELIDSGITPVLEVDDPVAQHTLECSYVPPQKSILEF